MARRITRRQLLVDAAAVGGGLTLLAGGGFAGHELFQPASAPAATGGGQQFLTRPDLRPPQLRVRVSSPTADLATGAADPFLLLTIKHPGDGLPQFGLMMVDRAGELAWFRPMNRDRIPFDLQVQSYRGQPVLTYWEGAVVDGHGEGTAHILDTSYREVAAFTGVGDTAVDLHEFTISPQGTALMTAYRRSGADLRSVGGRRNGHVYAGQVQEIDIATGRVVSTWDSLDHVPVDESYVSPPRHLPFDYFHINSIDVDSDGSLLISSRNTWTVYKVQRGTGEVIWRLGGKRSDFRIGPGANFERQHHVRMHPGNRLSIFDNAATTVEPASRGLVLQLDPVAGTADLLAQFSYPGGLYADNQGSMQWDPVTGAALLGYGNLPRVSAFGADGRLSFDATLGAGNQSYRALASAWHGRPRTTPEVVVTKAGREMSLAVSWNGATDVTHWRVLAGPRPAQMRPLMVVARSGFETTARIGTGPAAIAVEALDARQRVLGRSRTLEVRA